MKNIVIYTKAYCPYCTSAKKLLTQRGFTFQEIDVQHNAAKRKEMIKRSQRTTVPQIFTDNGHIGGFDDLAAYFKKKDKKRRAA